MPLHRTRTRQDTECRLRSSVHSNGTIWSPWVANLSEQDTQLLKNRCFSSCYKASSKHSTMRQAPNVPIAKEFPASPTTTTVLFRWSEASSRSNLAILVRIVPISLMTMKVMSVFIPIKLHSTCSRLVNIFVMGNLSASMLLFLRFHLRWLSAGIKGCSGIGLSYMTSFT